MSKKILVSDLKKHLPSILEETGSGDTSIVIANVLRGLAERGVIKPSKLEWKQWLRAIRTKNYEKISSMISKGFPINYRLEKYFNELTNPPLEEFLNNVNDYGAYDNLDRSTLTAEKMIQILDLLVVNGLDVENNLFMTGLILEFMMEVEDEKSILNAVQSLLCYGVDLTLDYNSDELVRDYGGFDPFYSILRARCSHVTKIKILEALLLRHPEKESSLFVVERSLKNCVDEKITFWLECVKNHL